MFPTARNSSNAAAIRRRITAGVIKSGGHAAHAALQFLGAFNFASECETTGFYVERWEHVGAGVHTAVASGQHALRKQLLGAGEQRPIGPRFGGFNEAAEINHVTRTVF